MKERININPDKKRIIRSLQELEFEYSQKNISRREYISQKKQLDQEIETLNTADRIRRLQGKGQNEKPLEYWTEKEERVKQKKEKEELLKQYVTSRPTTPPKTGGSNKFKTFLGVFLVVAFFVGTAFGAVLLKTSDTPGISMAVNESAFPVKNNTTTNNTIKTQDSTTKTNYTTTQQTTTTTKPTTNPTTKPTTSTGNST
jgi:hypothetical protein